MTRELSAAPRREASAAEVVLGAWWRGSARRLAPPPEAADRCAENPDFERPFNLRLPLLMGPPAGAPALRPMSLRRLRGERIVPALRRAMAAESPLLRSAAVIAIGRAGDAAPIFEILDALRDPDDRVRESAILALGLTGGSDAGPRLESILDDSVFGRRMLGLHRDRSIPDPLRSAAAFALGLTGDRRAVEALTAILGAAGTQPPDRVAAAICGLHGLAEPASAPTLLRVAASRTVPTSLRALAAGAVAGQRLRAGDEASLAALADDPEPAVRRAVLYALGSCSRAHDAEAALSALRRAVDIDDDVAARCLALLALGESGDETAPALLIRALAGRPASRAPAAVALALAVRRSPSLRDETALRLDAALADPAAATARGPLCLAAGLLGARRLTPRVVETAENPAGGGDASFAHVALGLLGAVQARPILLGALTDPEIPSRDGAAFALTLIEPPTAAARALSDAMSTEPRAGDLLPRVLARVADADTVERLVLILEDPAASPVIRARAALALGLALAGRDVPAGAGLPSHCALDTPPGVVSRLVANL